VTDMTALFENAWAFNRDINGWDTGKVINMKVGARLHYVLSC